MCMNCLRWWKKFNMSKKCVVSKHSAARSGSKGRSNQSRTQSCDVRCRTKAVIPNNMLNLCGTFLSPVRWREHSAALRLRPSVSNTLFDMSVSQFDWPRHITDTYSCILRVVDVCIAHEFQQRRLTKFSGTNLLVLKILKLVLILEKFSVINSDSKLDGSNSLPYFCFVFFSSRKKWRRKRRRSRQEGQM